MVCFKDDSVAAGWNVLEVSVKLVWRVIVSSPFFFFNLDEKMLPFLFSFL